eukprot:gene21602-27640_t
MEFFETLYTPANQTYSEDSGKFSAPELKKSAELLIKRTHDPFRTMHIRSNPQTIKAFQTWVDKIIDDNVNNDQKALNFGKLLKAKQTYDCNPHAQRFLEPLKTVYGKDDVKFCFLNELMFQNGKLAFNCAFDKFGSRSELMLAMAAMRFDGEGAVVPTDRAPRNKWVVNELPQLEKDAAKNKHMLVAPATVHANFCDNKEYCLQSLNLWLIQTNHSTALVGGKNVTTSLHTCKNYNVSETFHGVIDWQAESKFIRKE